MSLFHIFGKKPIIRIDFNSGPCVEIISDASPHQVLMFDGDTVIHKAVISGKHWTRANRKYFVSWNLKVLNEKLKTVYEHKLNLKGQNIRVNIDSKSLGDTLAWLPQIQRFSQQHLDSNIYVSQFWKDLFDESAYPNLSFIDPATTLETCYATYNIGYYFESTNFYHPADPRTIPLGQIAADILGIPFVEERPKLALQQKDKPHNRKPYVCIGAASTAECKHWLYPDGWQLIVDHLKLNNLETMVIQKEKTSLKRINDQTGDCPIGTRIEQLQNCEFFIGLGSGLSWLAWAVGKPVVMIAGFSEAYTEFEQDCERVINTVACHGCWNDIGYAFDRGDWNWCPRQKATDREFECSKLITPDMVIKAIQNLTDQ